MGLELELYLDLRSPPCRALYIFARCNNIPFEFKHVELMTGQHRTEEFRKVNILMKVPALKDGSFTLAESIAILLYLARKFKTPDHWYPSDLQKQARVDEYLSWQHANIRGKASKLFVSKVLVPLLTGQALPPEKLEGAIEELNVVLNQFEEKFLQDKPFIVGSHISLADLVALVELMQPVASGYDLFQERPKLAKWRSRVEEALGKEIFQEAHEEILNMKNVTADKIAPELLEHFKQLLLKQSFCKLEGKKTTS
ncbi:glutathione S-transferase theta-2B [Numida meleagris]|uniref:glutathione S-transferase theta-2B n=1 Tax=Numida meleagris TaxID=8996 RepID=UPI000B3DFC33|nr:glutathione S-transferase theta-2B [Numida meleagris]